MIKLKNTSCYAIVALFLTINFSCKKDFLDVTPKNQLSSETVFANSTNADIFINDIYGSLPDAYAFSYNYDPFEDWGDNSVNAFDWAMSWVLQVSRSYSADTYNPGLYNHTYPAMPFMYDFMYQRIRKCNLFIQQVNENANNFPTDWIKNRIAEVRFLRAFYYHEAWMAYGGVPIITTVLNRTSQGDSIFYPRSTSQETFKFIQSECAAVADSLPDGQGGGRATKGAALALKGWCELFNHDYQDAAATYNEIIDLGTYSLFPDYNAQFLTANNNNSETIFAYEHTPGSKGSAHTEYFGPMVGSSGSWGCMQPTQEFIDTYRMDNGLPITDPKSGYDPNHPYLHREERFYESIVYDGSVWRGDTIWMRSGGLYAPNPSKQYRTGYFLRKGIDPNVTQANWNLDGSNDIYFRYAGVLLGYAEAKIELGQIDQSVYDAIDQVRERAQLPSIEQSYGSTGLNQEQMRTIVRSERRVELAFENRRYWDLIRWETADSVLNQPAYGINITQENGQWVYNKFIVHTREFFQKNYLFPMYRPWIDQNPKIKAQNGGTDGWVNGQNPGY